MVDFNILNFNSIDDRILFLKYVLIKELDNVFENGNKALFGNKLLSDFYSETIGLLDVYIDFANRRDTDDLGIPVYSRCIIFTKLYNLNYKMYLKKYFEDSNLNTDYLKSYFKDVPVKQSTFEDETIYLSNNLNSKD